MVLVLIKKWRIHFTAYIQQVKYNSMQWYFPVTSSGKIQSSGPLHLSDLLKFLPLFLFGVPPSS